MQNITVIKNEGSEVIPVSMESVYALANLLETNAYVQYYFVEDAITKMPTDLEHSNYRKWRLRDRTSSDNCINVNYKGYGIKLVKLASGEEKCYIKDINSDNFSDPFPCSFEDVIKFIDTLISLRELPLYLRDNLIAAVNIS